MAMVVLVIADKKEEPMALEFLVHTESDLKTKAGREESPATEFAARLLDVFEKLR